MHKLEIKLKQHTPLIHFQHDQDGATLRASEVKPKLDKFILKKLTQEEREQGESQGWIKNKNGRIWFDYKMKIEASKSKDLAMERIPEEVDGFQKHDEIGRPLFTTPNYPDNGNSLIMGNMGGRPKEEVLNFVMFHDVAISFFFKSETLCNKVGANLNVFFFKTCFGNRTSKGFGSFTVSSINDVMCETVHITSPWSLSFSLIKNNRNNIYGDNEISEEKAIKDIFIVINTLWKGLKGYSGAPKGEPKSVFLNIRSNLTNNEDRIPSPVRFKPTIVSKSRNEWRVVVHVFLDDGVITAAGASEVDFTNKINQIIQNFAPQESYRGLRLSYQISNISIQ